MANIDKSNQAILSAARSQKSGLELKVDEMLKINKWLFSAADSTVAQKAIKILSRLKEEILYYKCYTAQTLVADKLQGIVNADPLLSFNPQSSVLAVTSETADRVLSWQIVNNVT